MILRKVNENRLPFRNYRNGNIPKKMTSEMWQVYKLIEENTNNGKTTTVSEKCNKVPYYTIHKKESNFSNCPKLYDDIYLINVLYRSEHDKYIITNSNKLKLATKEEAEQRYIDICTKYSKINAEKDALEDLFSNDGQYKMFSNQLNEIKGKTKPYKESYSK